MAKKIKILTKLFLVFFIFNSVKSFQLEKNDKKDENKIIYLANLFYYSYLRSKSTIDFWRELGIFKRNISYNTELILSRSRNPSKKIKQKPININENEIYKIYEETLNNYDIFALLLNNAEISYLKDTKYLNYLNKIREEIRSNYKNIINSTLPIFIAIKNYFLENKNEKRSNLKDNLYSIIDKLAEKVNLKSFLMDNYIKLDKSLYEIYEQAAMFENFINDNYELIWKIIETERMNKYKIEYNNLMKECKKIGISKVKKIEDLNSCEVKYFQDKYLPESI